MSKKIALVLVLAGVVAGCQQPPPPVVQPVVTPEPVFAGKYGN
ncbi:hypothetical protein [Paracoccus marinus]|nr:hypothetical protein [Paracoccus marinus]GLS79377.1 hypothetical protein GCM10007893_01510 [Paracoccus marinus]